VRPRSLLVRYAAGLAFAYLLTAAEVVAIVISVSGETVIGAQAVMSVKNLIATVALVVIRFRIRCMRSSTRWQRWNAAA
jgi:adenylate cyclase